MIFEFGGAYQNQKLSSTDPDRIYNLGLIVHDTRYVEKENNENQLVTKAVAIEEEIAFFCAGNLIDWKKKFENQNLILTHQSSILK